MRLAQALCGSDLVRVRAPTPPLDLERPVGGQERLRTRLPRRDHALLDDEPRTVTRREVLDAAVVEAVVRVPRSGLTGGAEPETLIGSRLTRRPPRGRRVTDSLGWLPWWSGQRSGSSYGPGGSG